jgi:hypothetical protein
VIERKGRGKMRETCRRRNKRKKKERGKMKEGRERGTGRGREQIRQLTSRLRASMCSSFSLIAFVCSST